MRNAKSRSHLVLCLGRNGFGEASLGVRLADDLMKCGDTIHFIAADSQFSLLFGKQPHFTFVPEASPLLPLFIEQTMKAGNISSFILSDYITAAYSFSLVDLNPTILTSYGIPIFAIDTWDSHTSPSKIDIFRDTAMPVTVWPKLVTEICPVPFLSPRTATRAYSSLAERVHLSAAQRRALRLKVGVSEGHKTILFCTAKWQHTRFEPAERRLLADFLPALIGEYIRRLGPSVHLVHVGPCSLGLESQIGDRYHWVTPCAREDFDALVAAMDMHLSANISATTIAKAMRAGVPTVVIQNSVAAGSVEEAEAASGRTLSPFLSQWLRSVLPLYPFALWPIGYYRFLRPLMDDNPYTGALDTVELLDEQRTEHFISNMLFDTAVREEQMDRQSRYLDQVSQLPSGPELLDSLM